MLGLKSTALRLGPATRPWLAAFYAGAIALWALAASLAGAHALFFAVLCVVAAQLAWQVATLDTEDSANCLARFKSNRWVGWLILAGLSMDMATSAGIL